jgi:hypothetical protein
VFWPRTEAIMAKRLAGRLKDQAAGLFHFPADKPDPGH